jgi:hypothetical protein
MVPYGFLTSRKQRALQLYRVDRFYRATFRVLLVFLLSQLVAAVIWSSLVYLSRKTDPQARENERRDKSLAIREAQDKSLIRKLETSISLKSIIANRVPATELIRGIEEAFVQNEGVSLTELKLSNAFDFGNPNARDDFTIIVTGAIKAESGVPTVVLGNFIKSLNNVLPNGAKADVVRNAVSQHEGAFTPFDVKIHYAPEK